MPMWAIVKEQRSRANTGKSSSVSQPGWRKSSCQPISAHRASRRSIRGSMVAEKPGSGGLTGETLIRTPRTPSASISASSIRGVLVHVHDAAAAADPDLAHGVEHAGIVAAVGARLHEHETLDPEQFGEHEIIGQRRQRRGITQLLRRSGSIRIAVGWTEYVEMRIAGERRRAKAGGGSFGGSTHLPFLWISTAIGP